MKTTKNKHKKTKQKEMAMGIKTEQLIHIRKMTDALPHAFQFFHDRYMDTSTQQSYPSCTDLKVSKIILKNLAGKWGYW